MINFAAIFSVLTFLISSTSHGTFLHVCIGMKQCEKPNLPESAEYLLFQGTALDDMGSAQRELVKKLEKKQAVITHLLVEIHGNSSADGDVSYMATGRRWIALNPFNLASSDKKVRLPFGGLGAATVDLGDSSSIVNVTFDSVESVEALKPFVRFYAPNIKMFLGTCYLLTGEEHQRSAKLSLVASLFGVRSGMIIGAVDMHAPHFTIITELGFVQWELPFELVGEGDMRNLMKKQMERNVSGYQYTLKDGLVCEEGYARMYDLYYFNFLEEKRRPVSKHQLELIGNATLAVKALG